MDGDFAMSQTFDFESCPAPLEAEKSEAVSRIPGSPEIQKMGNALGAGHRALSEEVPAGYKRTEVGVIPKDWIVRPLGSCLRYAPEYGINAAAVRYDDSLPTYLRITDISEDYRFRPSPRVSVKHPSVSSFFLCEGDLVFARTGASVGKSYRYDEKDGPLVFAGFLIRIRPDPEKLESVFLAYCVQSGRYWEWVATMSTRSGQPGINGQEYAMFQIPLPPLSEQRAIAKALSDVDGLLAALEALIAKKRAIKQAAMQQLLTGKTRLPGFNGKWVRKRLGELGAFSKGRGIKREDVSDTGFPCIRYGELYTRYKDYFLNPVSRIPPAVALQAVPIKKGDLLFAGSGETAEEIGICAAYLGEGPAYAGGDLIALTPSGQNSIYLGHLMNHPTVATQKARMGQGDAVVHISARNLAQVRIELPPLTEQTAIAAVLSDMDARIRLKPKRGHEPAIWGRGRLRSNWI